MKVFCVSEKLHAENEFEDIFLGRLLHFVHDFPLGEGGLVRICGESKFLQLGGLHVAIKVFSPFLQLFFDATILHHHLFAHEEFHLSAKHFIHGSLSSQNILRNTLREFEHISNPLFIISLNSGSGYSEGSIMFHISTVKCCKLIPKFWSKAPHLESTQVLLPIMSFFICLALATLPLNSSNSAAVGGSTARLYLYGGATWPLNCW